MHHPAQLRVHLGAAPANGQIAPDAAVGLGALAVEHDHLVHADLRLGGARARHEGRGVKAVEGFRRHARRRGHPQHLPAQLYVQLPVFRALQGVSDAVVGQGGGKQQRAVAELAPEIAHDVGAEHSHRLELAQQRVQPPGTRRDLPALLTDHHRAAPAVGERSRLQIVRPEVHEAAQHALFAHHLVQNQRIQTVLHRHHRAARRQMRGQRLARRPGVLGLGAEQNGVPDAFQLLWGEGRRPDTKLLDGADDLQSRLPDGRHMLGGHVHEGHVVPGPDQVRAQAAADGPSPPDQQAGLVGFGASLLDHCAHPPSSRARVSCTDTSQMACMSLSGR